jgi:hypothetical protein
MRRTNERQILLEEGRRELLSMLQRMAETKELVPWLRPGQSESDLRRTAARLRAGAIPGLDPRIPPSAIAEAIEKSLAQEHLVRSIAMKMIEGRRKWEELHAREEADRVQELAAGLIRLKKAPEASDPDSPAAEEVRRLHRLRRKEHGRPRTRKKKQ